MNPQQLFYAIALPTLILALLLIGAILVEVILPPSRAWLRRLHRLERGRDAQRAGGGR